MRLVHHYNLSLGTNRYGFNGMETDDEVKGEGNSYDFGARMYDSRLGRWLTIDPHASKYPAQSPFTFSLNSPILYKDPDGKDAIISIVEDGNRTTVTFSSTIYLTGKGVTPEYIEMVKAMAEYHFTNPVGSFTGEDGKTYILKLDFNFVDASISQANSGNLPKPVEGYITGKAIDDATSIDTKNEQEPNGLEYGDNFQKR